MDERQRPPSQEQPAVGTTPLVEREGGRAPEDIAREAIDVVALAESEAIQSYLESPGAKRTLEPLEAIAASEALLSSQHAGMARSLHKASAGDFRALEQALLEMKEYERVHALAESREREDMPESLLGWQRVPGMTRFFHTVVPEGRAYGGHRFLVYRYIDVDPTTRQVRQVEEYYDPSWTLKDVAEDGGHRSPYDTRALTAHAEAWVAENFPDAISRNVKEFESRLVAIPEAQWSRWANDATQPDNRATPEELEAIAAIQQTPRKRVPAAAAERQGFLSLGTEPWTITHDGDEVLVGKRLPDGRVAIVGFVGETAREVLLFDGASYAAVEGNAREQLEQVARSKLRRSATVRPQSEVPSAPSVESGTTTPAPEQQSAYLVLGTEPWSVRGDGTSFTVSKTIPDGRNIEARIADDGTIQVVGEWTPTETEQITRVVQKQLPRLAAFRGRMADMKPTTLYVGERSDLGDILRDNDPLIDEACLQVLLEKESWWFEQQYAPELSPNGFLVKHDGKETAVRPRDVIGIDHLPDVARVVAARREALEKEPAPLSRDIGEERLNESSEAPPEAPATSPEDVRDAVDEVIELTEVVDDPKQEWVLGQGATAEEFADQLKEGMAQGSSQTPAKESGWMSRIFSKETATWAGHVGLNILMSATGTRVLLAGRDYFRHARDVRQLRASVRTLLEEAQERRLAGRTQKSDREREALKRMKHLAIDQTGVVNGERRVTREAAMLHGKSEGEKNALRYELVKVLQQYKQLSDPVFESRGQMETPTGVEFDMQQESPEMSRDRQRRDMAASLETVIDGYAVDKTKRMSAVRESINSALFFASPVIPYAMAVRAGMYPSYLTAERHVRLQREARVSATLSEAARQKELIQKKKEFAERIGKTLHQLSPEECAAIAAEMKAPEVAREPRLLRDTVASGLWDLAQAAIFYDAEAKKVRMTAATKRKAADAWIKIGSSAWIGYAGARSLENAPSFDDIVAKLESRLTGDGTPEPLFSPLARTMDGTSGEVTAGGGHPPPEVTPAPEQPFTGASELRRDPFRPPDEVLRLMATPEESARKTAADLVAAARSGASEADLRRVVSDLFPHVAENPEVASRIAGAVAEGRGATEAVLREALASGPSGEVPFSQEIEVGHTVAKGESVLAAMQDMLRDKQAADLLGYEGSPSDRSAIARYASRLLVGNYLKEFGLRTDDLADPEAVAIMARLPKTYDLSTPQGIEALSSHLTQEEFATILQEKVSSAVHPGDVVTVSDHGSISIEHTHGGRAGSVTPTTERAELPEVRSGAHQATVAVAHDRLPHLAAHERVLVVDANRDGVPEGAVRYDADGRVAQVLENRSGKGLATFLRDADRAIAHDASVSTVVPESWRDALTAALTKEDEVTIPSAVAEGVPEKLATTVNSDHFLGVRNRGHEVAFYNPAAGEVQSIELPKGVTMKIVGDFEHRQSGLVMRASVPIEVKMKKDVYEALLTIDKRGTPRVAYEATDGLRYSTTLKHFLEQFKK